MDVVALGLAKADATRKFGVVVVSDGTTNDQSARINAAMTASTANGARATVTLIGTFYIVTLIVPSNCRLDASGATLIQIAGNDVNMLRSSAHDPVRTVTDAAITAASTTLTSATAAFTSADVGRPVLIAGAGTAVGQGGIKPLYTTITAVTNGTTATVALAAITTVSGATAKLYGRAKNITVTGGVWNRQNNGSSAGDSNKHAICMRRVDGLTLSDQTHVSVVPGVGIVTGKYSVNAGDVTDWTIDRISAPTGVQADLVHVNGPAARGAIRRISGMSNDDLVSLTAMDYAAYSDVSGSITDIDISQVVGDPSTACLLKLTSSLEQSCRLDRIRVRGLTHTGADTAFKAVNVKSDCGTHNVGEITVENMQGRFYVDGGGFGTVDSISIDNSRLQPAANTFSAVQIIGQTVTNLILRGMTNKLTALSSGGLLIIQGNGAVRGVVTNLLISDINIETNSAYLIQMLDGLSTLTSMRATNVRHNGTGGGGGLLTANASGAVVGDLWLSNVETVNSGPLVDLATTTTIWMQSVRGVNLARVRPTGAITVRGSGIALTGGTLTVDSGGTIRSLALDLPTDVSKLTKTAGDRATNTNAALACGTGPVITDGTVWKHLFTGATA